MPAGLDWLDEGPNGWTARYLAGQPLWFGLLAGLAMLLMRLLAGRAAT